MLDISPDLLRLGLSTAVVVGRGVSQDGTPSALIDYRRKTGQQLAEQWKKVSLSSHPVLAEYERVHQLFGVRDELSAPHKLLQYVKRHEDLTVAGPVVDCYNIVSAKTLLSIGAHDMAKIRTPITLRHLSEADVFQPLEGAESRTCAGEYGYVDPDHRIVCRMEVLQCDFTKVVSDTRDVIFFIQGNRAIGSADLLAGAWLLVELIERFLGGSAELVSFQEATEGKAA
ncbi:MAG TPA: phenylalanine--tRNA ligase beta subunit-related protein [Thermoanaerobaculia bacterium]|nr:phenylalanine--tRNA ligase beta subunit-related protein [Thermoanaerobaculia bacterium]